MISNASDSWAGHGWHIPLPPWPEDTHDCVFLGRAFKQIEDARGCESAQETIRAIEQGTLALRCRIAFEQEGRMTGVSPSAHAPEGWRDCLLNFYILERDMRPWVSVLRRRVMPQPHWLFVTRESLKKFLRPRLHPAAQTKASPQAIETAVKDYLVQAGGSPSIQGAEKYLREQKGISGHRPMIRAAYSQLLGGTLKRGKPAKKSAK